MADASPHPAIRSDAQGVLLALKVVPGARRSEIAGALGARLKVRVAAPPEDGKANAAVCELLAEMLGVRAAQVAVVAGQTRPEKTVRVCGISPVDAASRLGLMS